MLRGAPHSRRPTPPSPPPCFPWFLLNHSSPLTTAAPAQLFALARTLSLPLPCRQEVLSFTPFIQPRWGFWAPPLCRGWGDR